MSSRIHPTAIVDPKAELGEDVEVGAYSVIGPDVVIGKRTRIAPHVVIEGHTTLGTDNEVFQFASLGAAPQDLKFRGEPSTLIIGSRNKVREYVTLQPGTAHGRMTTTVGDGNLFMANSHVAHDCIVGSSNVFSNAVALAGHVTIGSNIILGGMAGIHQFCRIGDYALIGAGSMVGGDIPPYCIGQGDRCHLRGVNVIGLKRAGFSADQVSDVRRVYRLLFSTLGHINEKLESLPPELVESPHIKRMVDFIVGSKRGLINPLKNIGHGANEDL